MVYARFLTNYKFAACVKFYNLLNLVPLWGMVQYIRKIFLLMLLIFIESIRIFIRLGSFFVKVVLFMKMFLGRAVRFIVLES
jgi:hypothetical protein